MATSTKSPIRILTAANATYARPLCVMLTSLVRNQPPDRGLEIYVLTSDMGVEDRGRIERSICANRPGFDLADLHWLTPDLAVFRDFPLGEYLSADSYARLLAPRVLPAEVEKVLYLDSDAVVLVDVSELFDGDDESLVHAVHDIDVGLAGGPFGVFNCAEVGLDPQAHYFNAGVMLMNLRRWREEDLTGQVLDYLQRHAGSVRLADQGALNAVVAGAWTEIDLTWNQMRAVQAPERWTRLGYSRAKWLESVRRPKIVHYAGSPKPWQAMSNLLPLPRWIYFYEYLQRTEYRGTVHAPWLERLLGTRLYFWLWQDVRPALRRLAGRPAGVQT